MTVVLYLYSNHVGNSKEPKKKKPPPVISRESRNKIVLDSLLHPSIFLEGVKIQVEVGGEICTDIKNLKISEK